MKKSVTFLLGLIATASCGDGENPPPADHQGSMLIVTVPALEEAASSYAAFRQAAGFSVEISLTTELLAGAADLQNALAARVRSFAENLPAGERGFLLLLGDAHYERRQDPAYIPTFIAERSSNGYSWSAEGDGPYADVDGDFAPELAVGRLPLHDAAELAAYSQRLERHEKKYSPGPWNKMLPAFAGAGGFGPEIDSLLEMVTGWVFDELSYDFDVSMTYASPTSAYYLPRDDWVAAYADTYQAGSLLQPYIGHTLGAIGCCQGPSPTRLPMLTYFSCSDGTFQDAGPSAASHSSLAEEVLLRPQGPLATLAATTMSHPYGNAILCRELGHALLDERAPTYGEAVRLAKYNALYRLDKLRETIDAAAAGFMSEPLPEVCAEHLVMYNLLGDPSAPISFPRGEVEFYEPAELPASGGKIEVNGIVRRGPSEGSIVVTLELQRTKVKAGIIDCSAGCSREQYTANHRLANDKVLARAETNYASARFSVELDLPSLAAGKYYLKGYARDEHSDAIGSLEVELP